MILLDSRYNYDKNTIVLRYYHNGKIIEKIDKNYKPYFLTKYICQENANKLMRSEHFKEVKEVIKYNPLKHKKEKYLKVFGNSPLDIPKLRKIPDFTWEDKIRYQLSYLYDKQLICGMPEENKKNHKDKMDEIFDWENYGESFRNFAKNNSAIFFEDIPKPKMIALDIEVEMGEHGRIPDPDNAIQKIISCSFYSNDGISCVIILKEKKHGNLGTFEHVKDKLIECDTEKELISKCFKIMWKYPIILTYNGDNFDLPYMNARAKKLDIDYKDNPILKVRDSWGYKNSKEAYLKESIHVDMFRWFSNRSIRIYAYGAKYDRFGLDNVSLALLGKQKIEHEEEIDEMPYYELAWYNLVDSKLTLELMTYDNYKTWTLMILIMRICRLPISEMLRHQINAWIKSIFQYEHRRLGWLMPNKSEINEMKEGGVYDAMIEGKGYRGAFVIKPKAGIWFDVVVEDFASLYPSIIKEYNLSYESINCGHKECEDNKLPNLPYYTCKKRQGIASYIVGFFRDIRVLHFKPKRDEDKLADSIQGALKVFINGSYGVYGFKSFDFYCLPVAESTTAIGYDSIKKTMSKCNGLGVQVLYGDTDSVFLHNPTDKKLRELEKWSKDVLNLDLEEEYTFQFLALSNRKKNYVGIIDDGKIKKKGVMAKKRNTPDIFKKAANDLLEMLKPITNIDKYNKIRDKIINIVRNIYKNIGTDKYEIEKYGIYVQLGKDPDQYKKTTPQHVRAIRREADKCKYFDQFLNEQKDEREYKKGDIVGYIKTNDNIGAKLIEKANIRDLNLSKYKELYKSVMVQILDALQIKWEEIIGQKTL